MESWLSLTVSGKDHSGIASGKVTLLIAVPKKVVRLATQRNRIKRLIREAVRGDTFFKGEKIYTFKVRKFHKELDLALVLKEINALKTQ